MLSQLSKGYGSWTAGYVDPYFGEKKAHEHEIVLPEIDHETHIHGITVGPRSGRSTALSWATTKRSREPTMDGIPLPKTYTTRKGALQLYVGPEDLEDEDTEAEDNEKKDDSYALKPKYVEIKRPHGQELINLSLRLGTMERLAMSVLQFGDNDYDHEHTSVSDAKNRAFLKFLHDVDEGFQATDIDSSVQPGGELNNYLRDLKSSASHHSGNMRISKSRESLELQAILRGLDNNSNWPMSYSQDGAGDRQSVGQFTRPVSRVSSQGASPGPPSTPRSTYQVLSAKKVCASIKSGSYLGRPSSRVSVNDDDLLEGNAGAPVTSATVTQPLWTPTESTDDFLTESRSSFYRGDEDNDSDAGKRRGLKERSFLTNNSQLYKGRIARKGEGQRAGEVKVISKGDGETLSQRMIQIEEELVDISEHRKRISGTNLSSRGSILSDSEKETDNDSWAEKVTDDKHLSDHEADLEDRVHLDTSDVIDVEIETKDVENEAVEKVEVRLSSRPSSHKSGSSRPSSRPSSYKSGSSRPSSRPSSHKSDISYTGSTSTHTPSIITLQSLNSPVSQEKFRSLYKRRNTYAYDPEKGLVRTYKSNQRRKSECYGRKNINNVTDFSISQNGQGIQGAKRYRNGLYPGWTAHNNNNSDLALNANSNANWPTDVIQNMSVTSADNPDLHEQIQLDTELATGEENAEFVDHEKDMETFEEVMLDQEEYVIDNIEECNAEVKQIEEQAEGKDAIHDEEDSDLDSTMDEEMIKVILTGQSNEDLKTQDEYKTEETEVGLRELDEKESVDKEMEVGAEEVKSTENVQTAEEAKDMEDTDVNVEICESEASELVDETEVKSGGKGGSSPIANNNEISRQESQDDTVDEENASDIRSTKSGKTGRKTRSKKSRSGVGSEESEDVASTNEFVLPPLESDQLLEEKDGSSREETKTLDDEQTGFSGSTDSYSDILASDKNSRPVTANQSRPASSLKLSRPTSALARPSSVAEDQDIQDKVQNDLDANQDLIEKEEENDKKNYNEDANVEIMEDVVVQDKSEDSKQEKSKAVEENTKENGAINQSLKPEKNEKLTTLVDPTENNFQSKVSVESKAKPNISMNNEKQTGKPASKPEAKKEQEIKRTQPVPKVGKSINDKKTIGKHVAAARGVPPKQTKTTNDNTDKKSSQKGVEIDKNSKKKLPADSDLGRTVVEGEGLLDTVSEQNNKVDEVFGVGKLGGDSSGIKEEHDTTDAHAIASELDALGLRRKSSKGSVSSYTVLPPGKRPKPPPEKAKIPDHITEALNRKTDASIEYLEQDLERMTALVGESLSGPTLEAVGEGLTEEELELAKQILQQKIDEAQGKLEGKPLASKAKGLKKPPVKPGKKGARKGKGKQLVEEKSPEELDREAIREKHEQEKKQREQEAAELQRKISEKQQLLKEQNDLTSARSKELKEEMERLEREAEAIQRAEDEAREILADVRKKQREEREARRKADLERKKQEALERREREKKEMEEKRRKELEMMEKIADAEMRRRMREEEERKNDEEERLAQERYEAELREAQRLEEEEEERMKEMERQAEEEAMQRLIEEREAAERERRRLREEEEALQEAEYLRRLAMEEEQRKLEDERRRMQEAEEAKREAERQRLLELRRLEEEARMKMQEEIEKRRNEAMSRRDYNLENRMHVDKLRYNQGLTRAWTFSYFVHWPRETYERPIGDPDPRKVVKIKNPKPKQPVDAPAESGDTTTAGAP